MLLVFTIYSVEPRPFVPDFVSQFWEDFSSKLHNKICTQLQNGKCCISYQIRFGNPQSGHTPRVTVVHNLFLSTSIKKKLSQELLLCKSSIIMSNAYGMVYKNNNGIEAE